MANSKTPKLRALAVNIGAGVTTKFLDVGVQRAIFIPQGVANKNPTIRLGPTGEPFTLDGFTSGVFINAGEDFDELTITNNGGVAATGNIIMSPCCEFLVI